LAARHQPLRDPHVLLAGQVLALEPAQHAVAALVEQEHALEQLFGLLARLVRLLVRLVSLRPLLIGRRLNDRGAVALTFVETELSVASAPAPSPEAALALLAAVASARRCCRQLRAVGAR